MHLTALVCRCHQDGQYEQAVGLALDVRRLDKLEQSITGSSDQAATLSYALQACQQTVVNRAFRQEVSPSEPRSLPSLCVCVYVYVCVLL